MTEELAAAALAATTSTISGKLTRTLDDGNPDAGFWCRFPGLRSGRWPLRAAAGAGAEAVAPPARPTFRHSESAQLLLTSEEEAESTFEAFRAIAAGCHGKVSPPSDGTPSSQVCSPSPRPSRPSAVGLYSVGAFTQLAVPGLSCYVSR